LRSKVALQDLGTGKFYLLSAIVSLLTYAPYPALRPPARSELLPAFGLAFLMAVTFGVTTEAIRRGPLGTVSPITALSPALTAVLAILVLHEHIGLPAYLGVALAPAGIVLLSLGRQEGKGSNWPSPHSFFRVSAPSSTSLSLPPALRPALARGSRDSR
jgi:bacterial/archaeal transporter family protein